MELKVFRPWLANFRTGWFEASCRGCAIDQPLFSRTNEKACSSDQYHQNTIGHWNKGNLPLPNVALKKTG